MSQKSLFAVTLALFLCLSLIFSASAQALTPPDIILEHFKELSEGYDRNFYNKAVGKGNLEIIRLKGSLLKGLPELPDLEGATIRFDSKLDTPGQKASLDFEVEFQGQVYPGRVFLQGDKIIFTKEVWQLVQALLPGIPMDNIGQFPAYLYIQDPQLAGTWKSLMDYRDQKMMTELREFLRFFLEAIPHKYFSVSWNKITLELDQAGWEDVLYNLVEKVKNEPERFADLVVRLMTMGDYAGVMGDPEKIKQDILCSLKEGIAKGILPGREQIREIAGVFQVEEFRYAASLIPGGSSEFKARFVLQADSGFTGQLAISGRTTGDKNNLEGSFSLEFDITEPGGTRISGNMENDFALQDNKASSQWSVAAGATNAVTGETLLDLELAGEEASQVDLEVNIGVPALTADNSINLSAFLPEGIIPKQAPEPPFKAADTIMVFIDGDPLCPKDATPFIQDGRTMVPLRATAEALNCQVQWIEPNEVRITQGERVISMYIGQNLYRINGASKAMDVVPVVKEGKTFIPLRFLASELGLRIEVGEGAQKIYLYSK